MDICDHYGALSENTADELAEIVTERRANKEAAHRERIERISAMIS